MRKVEEKKEEEKVILEVDEDVRINDEIVLEKGDRIQVFEKSEEEEKED